MKIYNPKACGSGGLTIDSFDYILTSAHSYTGDAEYSVLIDDNGNVLVCDC